MQPTTWLSVSQRHNCSPSLSVLNEVRKFPVAFTRDECQITLATRFYGLRPC